MSSQTVSIVVPTRNRADLLEQTLSAAVAQSHARLEIIVVDDASSDHTPEVIDAAKAADARIRGLRLDERRGAAAARNTGAANARGAFLLFEDDDCRGHPTRLARLVGAIEGSPDAAYAYCWMHVVEGGRRVGIRGLMGPWSIGTPYALIRREAFESVGGFDERLPRLQDFDLWTRLLSVSGAVEVPEALFETVRDGSGISTSTENLRVAARRILDKYRDSALNSSHLATMHRLLAGRLLLEGARDEGLVHYRRSVELNPRDPRSWIGFAAGALGSSAYRLLVGLQESLTRRRRFGTGRRDTVTEPRSESKAP